MCSHAQLVKALLGFCSGYSLLNFRLLLHEGIFENHFSFVQRQTSVGFCKVRVVEDVVALDARLATESFGQVLHPDVLLFKVRVKRVKQGEERCADPPQSLFFVKI